MSIDNYFQLTFHLVCQYVNSIFPETSNYTLKHITNEKKLKQSELYFNDEKILIISFTEISQHQSLVNVINLEGRLDNALINWEWFYLYDIKFPISKSDIPQDLIDKFNTKFRLLIDEEKSSSIFETSVDQPGPIIEEQTDTEEKERTKSPTPQVVPQEVPQAPPQPITPQSSLPTKSSSHPVRPADMPDFEDEYQIKDARQNDPQIPYPSIGDDDLNPPGIPKHPEMKPYLDPVSGGGGMHPTPAHPLFGRVKGNSSRQGVPPGARFDDPFGEDNLDDLGKGLPGNLRGPPGGPSGSGGFSFGGGFSPGFP